MSLISNFSNFVKFCRYLYCIVLHDLLTNVVRCHRLLMFVMFDGKMSLLRHWIRKRLRALASAWLYLNFVHCFKCNIVVMPWDFLIDVKNSTFGVWSLLHCRPVLINDVVVFPPSLVSVKDV